MTPSPDYDTGPTPMTDTNTAAALSAEADGWIEWHGGENPVGDQVVEVAFRDGKRWLPRPASRWDGLGCWENRIIAYRVATPAPAALEGSSLGEGDRVSAYVAEYEFRGEGGDYSPTEGERLLIEDAIHGFIADRPLQTAASHDALRWAQDLVQELAPDQGEAPGWAWSVAVRLQAALQPSSAADAKPVAWRWTSDLWSAGGWRYSTEKPDPKGYHGKITIRALYDQLVGAASDGHRHTAIMEAIRKDIVRQHPGAFTEDSDAEIVIPVGAVPVTLYVKIDVSALAEAVLPLYAQPHPSQQAGAEGDSAFKIASDLHAAYEQLIYGLPKYLEAKGLTDEENMINEAYVTLDVTAHRLAALKPVEG